MCRFGEIGRKGEKSTLSLSFPVSCIVMETFQGIFCSGLTEGRSCSSKSEEDVSSSCERKILMAAPKSSGRTSLLFEVASLDINLDENFNEPFTCKITLGAVLHN